MISVVLETQAIEIVSKDITGGGANGYAKTAKSSITVDAPGLAGLVVSYTQTNIVCSGVGYDQCPGIVANSENYYDSVDESFANDLMEFAETQVDENDEAGSHSVTVLVDRESEPRIYRVDWAPNSNGGTLISVHRDDL